MLQVNYIRENKEEVLNRLQIKNFKQPELVHQVIELDDLRKHTQSQLDSTLEKAKNLATQIGAFMKSGNKQEAENLKIENVQLKEFAKTFSDKLDEIELELKNMLYLIPNIPSVKVPKGFGADDNETILSHGNIPSLYSGATPHWELATKYNLIDFELGNKITGAGFPVYKGKGAKLQRALINFFLAEAEKEGYEEVQPPILVNEASGYGTGQLPDKEGQMYFVGIDNLYLIPTAEVPITNLYRDVILKEEEMPIKNAGYTPCFRREAGSYGAHVRGLNRLHQFDKVEIVQVVHPESSYEILEKMSLYVQFLLQKLELPYRVLRLCGGDMSFASALTYDMEVYSAAQEKWLEVSSVSNFESFQANRLKLRYKNKEGKNNLCHTLNGSALALPRIVASLLENNQTSEGILIPKALQPYTGFTIIS